MGRRHRLVGNPVTAAAQALLRLLQAIPAPDRARIAAWIAKFPITRGARYSVVMLFLLSAGFGVVNLLWTSHQVNSTRAQIVQQQERQRAADARTLEAAAQVAISKAVAVSNHAWCSSLNILLRRPVSRPAHPAHNQSRELAYQFYQSLRAVQRQYRCS